MCERCVEATRHVGEPMPPQAEFLDRVIERAGVTFEAGALQHDVVLTEEAQEIAMIAFQCLLTGMKEVMHEEGILWSKGWIVMLGAAQWQKAGGPMVVLQMGDGDPDAGASS